MKSDLFKHGGELLMKNAPRMAAEALKLYNELAMRGSIAQARARIKVEFDKNRELALWIYQKYEDQMDERVKEIYREFL